MLETLLGSVSTERVLIFIFTRKEGYASEIAGFYGTSLSPIQNQLAKLEIGGVLVSKLVGKTRVYAFNPRYPLLDELRALIDKAFSFYPSDVRNKMLYDRRRPRRAGKPL